MELQQELTAIDMRIIMLMQRLPAKEQNQYLAIFETALTWPALLSSSQDLPS